MTARGVRTSAWLALVLALPVPIALLGPGWVPAGHLAELGAASLAVGLAESLRGVVGWTALIFLGQALVDAALLFALATAAVRALGRRSGVLLARAAALVAVALIAPIYHSPYSARAARATLLEVYR